MKSRWVLYRGRKFKKKLRHGENNDKRQAMQRGRAKITFMSTYFVKGNILSMIHRYVVLSFQQISEAATDTQFYKLKKQI